MKLQQIYNATFNHFAEKKLWPQYMAYNPEWELSPNVSIKNAFDLGKKDGMIEKIKNELENEEVAYEDIQLNKVSKK